MTHLPTSRRSFLATTSTMGIAVSTPLLGSLMQMLSASAVSSDRILVVIQMSGGNDGLNTIVPYRHDVYKKGRPKLGISASDVRKVNDEYGLHPSLGGVERLLEAQRFSIVHGVGYPTPNRSHFESMDIWHSCRRKEDRGTDGWLGRWFASQSKENGAASQGTDALGLHLGHEQQPLALAARGIQIPSIASVEQFRLKIAETVSDDQIMEPLAAHSNEADLLGFLEQSTESAVLSSKRLNEALKGFDGGGTFPETGLGEKLKVVSRLILAGMSTKVYYVTLDGFDTHSNQALAHSGLLRQWSDALDAFVKQMESTEHADRVLVMTFSEFGRRVDENASEGTDHGAAAPVYFAGPKLPKPVIGALPSLTDLVDGDLRFHTDFRRVYASIIQQWFQSKSQDVLGAEFAPIDLMV